MSSIVVIGAGVGGLASAARLASLGHDVTVLEQSDVIGGKLGTVEHDGFLFDTGPSLVTMPYVFAELFGQTGAPLESVLELRRLEVACRYRFADGTELDMPGRVEEIPGALDAALGSGTGRQWSSFLERSRSVWDIARGPFLESPITAAGIAMLAANPRSLAKVAPWRSLRGFGEQDLADPRLRALLDRYATYTGSDPRRAPSALATVPYAEQAYGSWYVPGGLWRLGAAIADRARECGARIRTGVDVTRILQDGARVSGVETADGQRITADVVVSNADAETVYGKLLRSEGARRAARSHAKLDPSLSGFVLLLALDGLDDAAFEHGGATHHRVLFAEDYDAEFDSIFGVGGQAQSGPKPVERPTIYIAAPDDPAIVPGPGSGAWFVLVNAPRHDPEHGVDWNEPGLAERYAASLLDLMAERGVDVRDHVRWMRIRTPADIERETRSPGGSIYGTASNGAKASFLRPANRQPVEGLYLVGGSSHPGGGLPLVTLSAAIVAEMIGPAERRGPAST
ncbi:NAD(P)/FAD-dependent oxidoreductase [Pseudoclavibacter sp. RFBA6]|uniref:phytoene desaturase family protein n=1 Tax=Pseudoclavibacter sp. RFBA6 TaxID=2080573 RepID=UPI000CE82C18|nr:phytoene desaturase family protein [Pseudoclavibacter sp. RFBA6]PPG39933.1 phytoene desaturase [Pseudoclavibacter sp. RFBA6]